MGMTGAMSNRIETTCPDDHFHMRFSKEERCSLRQMAEERGIQSRRDCLDWLYIGSRIHGNVGFALELLNQLVDDPREDIHERALCYIGDYIEQWPHRVWPTVERLVRSRRKILELVPSFLLEHLIEFHFDEYYPKVTSSIEQGEHVWLQMLDGCYRFGQTLEHTEEIDTLLREHGIEPRFTNVRSRRKCQCQE